MAQFKTEDERVILVLLLVYVVAMSNIDFTTQMVIWYKDTVPPVTKQNFSYNINKNTAKDGRGNFDMDDVNNVQSLIGRGTFLDAFSKPSFDRVFQSNNKTKDSQCYPSTSLMVYPVTGSPSQFNCSNLINSLEIRLATFQNLPASVPISTNSLAQAGFYYTGVSDIVQCPLCGVCLGDWQMGDQPVHRHASSSPHCPFVKRTTTTTTTMSSSPSGPLPILSYPHQEPDANLDSGYLDEQVSSLGSFQDAFELSGSEDVTGAESETDSNEEEHDYAEAHHVGHFQDGQAEPLELDSPPVLQLRSHVSLIAQPMDDNNRESDHDLH